jgi:dipeptidyl aminopeptidase/acylaminoacyl peptidase
VPGDRIAYVTPDGSLMVAGFDPERLAMRGTPVAVATRLPHDENGVAWFDVSRQGSLAFIDETGRLTGGPWGSPNRRTLVRVDRRGAPTPLTAAPAGYDSPRLSPDGRRLAVTIRQSSRRDVWQYELDRETLTQLTFDGASSNAVWTPDGKRIVFWSDDGHRNLFWQPVDRSAPAERLLTSPNSQWPAAFTPDGRLLTFVEDQPNGGDLWLLPFDGDGRPHAFVKLPRSQYGGRLSPDGRWAAYSSDETGRWQIYVTPLTGGEKIQVSSDGGEETLWAHSGRERFYRNGTKMMVVPIEPGERLRIGKPRVLFDHVYARCCPGQPQYDIEPDDQTFIMIQDAQETVVPHISLVLNWVNELVGLVPEVSRTP